MDSAIDALADVLLRLVRFLGQRGHAVEAQERKRRDGDARRHEVRVHLTRLVDRVEDEAARAAAAQHEVGAKSDERDHGHNLDDEDDPVNAAAHLNAANVDERVERDERHSPQPGRAARHQRHAPVHHHDDEQGGNQHVVEQDQPARHEAHVRVDAALHVGVHRTRNGEPLAHAHVAHSREQNGHEADDVHQRRHAVAVLLDGAENGLRRDNHHEQDAVQYHVP